MDFGARGDILWDRLRRRLDADDRYACTKNRRRNGRAPARQHRSPPNIIAVLRQLWVGLQQAANRLSIRKPADPPQMGEAEARGVFQAVAERAVEADMG